MTGNKKQFNTSAQNVCQGDILHQNVDLFCINVLYSFGEYSYSFVHCINTSSEQHTYSQSRGHSKQVLLNALYYNEASLNDHLTEWSYRSSLIQTHIYIHVHPQTQKWSRMLFYYNLKQTKNPIPMQNISFLEFFNFKIIVLLYLGMTEPSLAVFY